MEGELRDVMPEADRGITPLTDLRTLQVGKADGLRRTCRVPDLEVLLRRDGEVGQQLRRAVQNALKGREDVHMDALPGTNAVAVPLVVAIPYN